nr:META domain-containing protein [uncultured Flavobacterium sp.]
MIDSKKNYPELKSTLKKYRFMGVWRCNTFTRTIFYEKDLLRFTDVISTLMAYCPKGNKENDFTKALQSTTTYSLKDNRLSLSNSSGKQLLVFKKVD